MKYTASIDSDCKCLNRYFHKLFAILQESRAEDRVAPIEAYDADADEYQATYHRISHFIKPDMVMNIYSLIDFWMKGICGYQKAKKKLSLSYRDIKGKNELDAYQKYLTEYAGIDLTTVQTSYKHLDNLRKVRNLFIHSGGHVPSKGEREFSGIDGVALDGTLIVIEDSFIWAALDHTKTYLQAAVQA